MTEPFGRTLAVDYGGRRVGVAVGDALGLTARPLTTIDRRATPDVVAELAAIARREDVARVLVGIPRLASGDEGAVAGPARALARALADALAPVDVIEVDEGDTSREAAQRLASVRRPRRRSDGRPADRGALDAAAAAVLLEGWLAEQRAAATGSPGR